MPGVRGRARGRSHSNPRTGSRKGSGEGGAQSRKRMTSPALPGQGPSSTWPGRMPPTDIGDPLGASPAAAASQGMLGVSRGSGAASCFGRFLQFCAARGEKAAGRVCAGAASAASPAFPLSAAVSVRARGRGPESGRARAGSEGAPRVRRRLGKSAVAPRGGASHLVIARGCGTAPGPRAVSTSPGRGASDPGLPPWGPSPYPARPAERPSPEPKTWPPAAGAPRPR
ncbi:translation initiation factor IF-2-like isoform X2 [Antechinus flavipes]|uniref:translation initiation factor IF-2-like isoform X2 n=1 Tax=Antechinus flavipes TaxID=38775 RepID=UPI002235BAA1|nr:translation initiation factor IF-2-like isoform X2 [Antechinus flavipes]